jgi:hypothetical protein
MHVRQRTETGLDGSCECSRLGLALRVYDTASAFSTSRTDKPL